MAEPSEDIKRYNKLYRLMNNARSKYIKYYEEDEEFYLSDIDETRTQFNKSQLDFIKKKYDIPISTKIVYAIVEQVLAFITGGKPSIELMAQEEIVRDWVILYKRLINSIWYENNVNSEFYYAIRDMLVTGAGYLHVRPNSYYQESTFGVVVERVDWKNVYIDPYCTKWDLSDADYAAICYTMPKGKAEREFDISISKDDTRNELSAEGAGEIIEYAYYDSYPSNLSNDEFKPIWIKNFYEKKNVKVYITPEGYISLEEPIPSKITNKQKVLLGQQINVLEQQMEQMVGMTTSIGQMEQQEIEDTNQQYEQIKSQLEQMYNQFVSMPDLIDGYVMIMENGRPIEIEEYMVIKQKRVENTLMVGDKIKYRRVLPTDEIPIIRISYTDSRNINKYYGAIHTIKDLVKAMNKLWGAMIYDMQMRTSLRVIYANQSVADPVLAESKFALPGAWIGYDADPELPDGGRPTVTDVSAANQYIIQALQMLQQMIEYITGIYGVIQGDPSSAPNTASGTQSLQTFGTQRVKLLTRKIESASERLAYVLVLYLQKFCPREKVLQLLGEDIDITIMDQSINTKFKVRCSIHESLPTSRQIASAALSRLAATAQTPGMQQLFAQYMLRFLDIKEADQIAQELQVVQQLEQQLQTLQQEVQKKDAVLKNAEHNLAQKEVAMEAELAKAKIQAEVEKQEAVMQASEPEQQPELPIINI